MLESVLCAGACLFAVIGTPAAAQTDDPGRVFSRIEVTGNDRFRDGDVIATSGLRTGVPLTEADVEAAVGALDYTAEFRKVRVYSSGETLFIEVEEEPKYSGGLTFGLGFDTDVGFLGAAYLSLENALGGDAAIDAGITISDEYQEFSASVDSPTFYGGNRAGGVRAGFARYEYDDTTYDYRTGWITPYISFGRDGNVVTELRYTLGKDDIYDIDDETSSIIKEEEGDTVSSGVGFTLATGNTGAMPDAAGPFQWWARFDQDFTGVGGDTSLSRTRVSFTGRVPLGGAGWALRTRVEAGNVVGLGDDDPRASDRFTLGGSSLRGFERGTVGPRDVCLGCADDGDDVITTLGGNHYAVARTDLILPLLRQFDGLETFIFGDVGSVWKTFTDVAADGELDDDLEWRRSAGIGLTWTTPFGDFESYYALATDAAEYDEKQEFGLVFRSTF